MKTKSNTANSTIASYIDHTLLRPDADERMIRQLCAEALEHQFAAVCVPPCYVKIASSILGESPVKIATVIGFPFGYQTAEVKFFEAHKALSTGATEIDVVWNLAAFKTGKLADVENEIGELATLCHLRGGLVKVIIETALLSEEEIIDACAICAQAEADFVKTSTGFAPHGATVEDVLLMRQNLPERVRIKASGGIRDLAFAKELIQAGADRLGTSAGVQLIKHENNQI
ncbi:deoxyribose-phosphate aldolase [Adhaeribacter pallidiroseus]|uniref:Deoxyribose-phosphate aldolase n=1 Tax=Adhaeribacter pallidiroseus TaxID=2072847 RepID=A0A369QK05_9BACT|nr:deoxyribose-phosphate aldolase [Adhaeribacter pallidiroseus]RDC64722.1 Deoxyribose-phosphate aldolase [Adhaeribacter pallidiroseus]